VLTPRPGRFYPRERTPVPIVQVAGWAFEPVWTGAENLAPTGVQTPNRPVHSESLHRLRYSGPIALVYYTLYYTLDFTHELYFVE
jgi:hypothetical protein